VDVVYLKHTAQIRLIRHAGAQTFDRGRLVTKRLQEGEGKLIRVARLLRER